MHLDTDELVHLQRAEERGVPFDTPVALVEGGARRDRLAIDANREGDGCRRLPIFRLPLTASRHR